LAWSAAITPATSINLPVPDLKKARAFAHDGIAWPAWLKSVPFFALHAACISVFFTSVHLVDWIMFVVFYFTRMFGITAGYHRYFSHKSYKTSRPFQFVLAWIGCSALQKGPLWWAGHHRLHHKHSDTEHDVHSPITKTVWDAHVGWILKDANDPTHWHMLKDWVKFPELVWLNKWHWVPGICMAVMVYFLSLAGGGTGWGGLAAGFVLSTVVLYHTTFMINSLAHLVGKRRYDTTDLSRNNWLLAILAMGEGWHNNHHHYQNAARQGFFWWEIDVSYYILKMLSWVGIVWDLKQPPAKLLGPEYRTLRDLAPAYLKKQQYLNQ
jgi:stearoyl-CoA desaturase (delta-9 desaturase)